jgi:hypothetical protein
MLEIMCQGHLAKADASTKQHGVPCREVHVFFMEQQNRSQVVTITDWSQQYLWCGSQ